MYLVALVIFHLAEFSQHHWIIQSRSTSCYVVGRLINIDTVTQIWDLSTRSLLSSFLFPRPITVLSVDPSERFFFAASQDGSIYQVNLFRRRSGAANMRGVDAIGGGGMSDVIRLADDDIASQRLISVGYVDRIFISSLFRSNFIPQTKCERPFAVYDSFPITRWDVLRTNPHL